MAELHEYEVPARSGTRTVKMSEEDAELIYGDRAKRLGDAKQGVRPETRRPPWQEPVPAEGESDPATGEDVKKAPARRNKARSADSDKA